MSSVILRILESGVAAVIATIVTLGYAGFVVSCLWGWYVAPLGVSQISWAHAMGLIVLMSVLSPSLPPEPSSNSDFAENMWTHVIKLMLLITIAWIVGWFLHFWV